MKTFDLDSKSLGNLAGIEDLSAYLSNATENLHIVGADTRILWANETLLSLLGYERNEYIGHSIVDFHIDMEIVEDMLERLLKCETLTNYPCRLRAKDGQEVHVLVNSSGYWKNGEFSHTRCFIRNVTGLFDLTDQIQETILLIRAKRLLYAG